MTYTLPQLEADLMEASRTIDERLAPVVGQAAANVATDAREQVDRSGHPSADYAARNLGYTAGDPDDLEVEVGYATSVGPLASAIEYGTSSQGPGGQLASALRKESPRFAEFVGKVGAAIWRS